MLRELQPTRQVPGDPPRRWFMSPRCDLIVWFHDDNTVRGFQLCYDKEAVEHAFTWIADRGYNHMRVDGGQGQFTDSGGGGTPILVANGSFDPGRILEIFQTECELVPTEFVSIVLAKLREVAGSQAGS